MKTTEKMRMSEGLLGRAYTQSDGAITKRLIFPYGTPGYVAAEVSEGKLTLTLADRTSNKEVTIMVEGESVDDLVTFLRDVIAMSRTVNYGYDADGETTGDAAVTFETTEPTP